MDSNVNFAVFQNNLRDLIKSHNMTIKSLASEIHISHISLSRYLNDHRDPDLRYVVALASYFNVSVDWLLGLSWDKYEILAPDVQELVDCYCVASSDDRMVVDAVLSKYKKKEQ